MPLRRFIRVLREVSPEMRNPIYDDKAKDIPFGRGQCA
jgi:hypothetical protein